MKRATITIILIITTVFSSFAPCIRAHAAENTFQIGQIVEAAPDVDPPTDPTALVATAVSSTQINLSWTASTDNVGVTGYRIYRDLVHIATSTTGTTYQDSGLTPSTLYAYTVTAIDAAYNESGHSATSSATTFAVPPSEPPTSGTNTGGTAGSIELLLLYLRVEPGLENATIRFGTNLDVLSAISWGLTPDYEIGTISSALYLKDHVVNLEDLEPDTRYYFKIRLLDGYGRVRVIDAQQFRTLPSVNETAPENVSNLRAVPNTETITLTWKNPEANFDSVRILRSDKFYPRDPFEGKVIYEGTAEKFVDEDVVKEKKYYYTAFTKDPLGNYSSGAVAAAMLLKDGEKPGKQDLFGGVLVLSKDLIHPMIEQLSLLDVEFIQDGKRLPIVSDTVNIKGDRSLTIRIAYEKVPEILKTIAITLYDPVDPEKTFSFLLRVNKDKTAYEAYLGALERPGNYAFGIAILDLKNQGLKKMAGVLVATVPDLVWEKGNNLFDTFTNNPFYAFSLVLLAFLILIIFLLSKIFRKKEQRVIEVQRVEVQK